MTERSRELSIYYTFADRCDDSFEIMTRVLKKHFACKKPSRIKYQLEYSIVSEYVEIMQCISDDEIQTARNQIANENGSLFYFAEDEC